MKRPKMNLKAGSMWLSLLVLTNLFFIFVVWLTAPEVFGNIIVMIVLFTVIVVLAGYWISQRQQKKQMAALETFLSSLDEETEQILLENVDQSWHSTIQSIAAQMREQVQMIKDKQLELQNYQEFIEAWTHEIKTPLSLATLVLGNHKEDMSLYVYKRMEYVRCVINRDIEKILYYARLHTEHVDYKFEKISLSDCIQECLEDFRTKKNKKNIDLQLNFLSLQIVSDKKVLSFMISQLLSNAFKYTAPENGVVRINSFQDTKDDKKIHLAIRDNGEGAPLEDMPFLFDKGFTGNHTDRQNATGMGLYFVKKYAKALSIEVTIGATSVAGKDDKGFEIELIFPNVE